jgi:hypothetical protein
VPLKINADIVQASTAAFQTQFMSTVALSLNISRTRVSIVSILPGSVIINTVILPDTSSNSVAAPTPAALAQNLVQQAQSTTSPLAVNAANVLQAPVDTSYTPAVLIQCSDFVFRAVCAAPSVAAPSPTADSSSLSMTTIIIGAGAAVVALIVIFLGYRYWQNSNTRATEEAAAAAKVMVAAGDQAQQLPVTSSLQGIHVDIHSQPVPPPYEVVSSIVVPTAPPVLVPVHVQHPAQMYVAASVPLPAVLPTVIVAGDSSAVNTLPAVIQVDHNATLASNSSTISLPPTYTTQNVLYSPGPASTPKSAPPPPPPPSRLARRPSLDAQSNSALSPVSMQTSGVGLAPLPPTMATELLANGLFVPASGSTSTPKPAPPPPSRLRRPSIDALPLTIQATMQSVLSDTLPVVMGVSAGESRFVASAGATPMSPEVTQPSVYRFNLSNSIGDATASASGTASPPLPPPYSATP